MKNRNWSKTSLMVVFVAGALALLIFMSTAYGKRTESSMKVQQGQEIILGDNLKIVVGRIEAGQAEISIYRNTEAAQPILLQHEKPDREPPDKSNPCPCSCPEGPEGPKGPHRPDKDNNPPQPPR